MYDLSKESLKTSEDYITFIKYWLSGDAGWTEENIEAILLEFKAVILQEFKNFYFTGSYSGYGTSSTRVE